MAEPRKIPSIAQYASLMIGVVLFAFVGFAGLTYQEFHAVRADLDATGRAAARDEVVGAMQRVLEKSERAARRFAEWEEVRQQLQVPRYYAYWRSYRMFGSGILPDTVEDAAIYDPGGRILAEVDDLDLSAQIALPPPPAYVDYGGSEPLLLVFAPVHEGSDRRVIGYVGLRIRLLTQLRESRVYRYADPASIAFERPGDGVMSWSGLTDSLTFAVRPNPMSESVSRLVSGTIISLSVILGLLALVLFPLLVYLIARPLRAISAHIDRLTESPGGLMLDELGGLLPIAETEKIRHSLNAYQDQLVDVHSTLEEKSEELWIMAHHDPLTGARNRRAYDEYLRGLPDLLGDRGVAVGFALFDVNHFKILNDSYGHAVGDQVLKVIASRISSVLRRGEEIFRIGGDEFAVILIDCDEDAAQRIAERCHERIVGYDFGMLGIREPLRISAGLAVARLDAGDELQSLQWKADTAMYQAKRPGHANVVLFTESMARDSESLFSSWVNTAVYDAVIYGKGLVMHYQPIVDLRDGSVCHYEALVRIEQDGEIVRPESIFPVVEARRLEVELDRAVARAVLEDLKQGKIPAGTGVSINLSGPSLVHEGVVRWLDGFRPFLSRFRVMIEVTETAMITQIGLANENLARLRGLGFEIALDDFGSGYSSVRYLANMPVDAVKFDISLIQGLRDESQRVMVMHLAQMILESGHQLIAEGVEDKRTLAVLRTTGFERAQGWYFGRPDAVAGRAANDAKVARFPSDKRA
jgi:diguanylate cyclase (GGDEF)-like protein